MLVLPATRSPVGQAVPLSNSLILVNPYRTLSRTVRSILFGKMLLSIVVIIIIFGNEAYSIPIDGQYKRKLPAAAATEVFGKDNGINH